MTGTPHGHWIQCVVCQVKERGPGQPDELLTHATYGQSAVVLKQKPPKRPIPPSETAPSLPAGVKRTCEDRVLVYDIQDNSDRELSPAEVGACKAWLLWRWGQNQDALRPKVEA